MAKPPHLVSEMGTIFGKHRASLPKPAENKRFWRMALISTDFARIYAFPPKLCPKPRPVWHSNEVGRQMDTTVKVNKAAMTRRWLNSAIKAADANGNQPPWWRGRDGAAWRKSAGQRARQA